MELTSSLTMWAFPIALVLMISSIVLSKLLLVRWTWRDLSVPENPVDPPQVPHIIPIIGNLVSYLIDAPHLFSSITQRFGASAIVRLNFLNNDIYVISGPEYLNAIWKNTKGLTATVGINTALHNMFDTPKQDIIFLKADDSGISHNPHPQSSTRPEDRYFYLNYKATVDSLTGSHLTNTAQRYQTALNRRIEGVPIQDQWVELDDLFSFLRPLIFDSSIETMCGADFQKTFPEFVDNFWKFNDRMPKLLHGWPRWMIPKTWQARDRCISLMKQWRKMALEGRFNAHPFFLRRWSDFSKMRGFSEDGAASSDLGVLWAMNASPTLATFWLIWHMMQSRSLLLRATSEINACRTTDTTESFCFDIKKLCGQPLLQSSFAETLRMYIADFILRKPEYEDALILDYKIPRNKSILISSTMAHMDKRHWNLGVMEEHPVEKFWADRFLTYSRDTSSSPASTPSLSATSSYGPPDPKFSLNGYSGSWIPFGGGLHQCPGRHWVKVQMLLSFAIISEAFEIEPLAREGGLKVDMGKYGLGALIPAEKAGFRIRRKKTAV